MTIKAGTTIKVNFTLTNPTLSYKRIYVAIYTNESNPALFYYGNDPKYIKILDGAANNKISCTVPASISKSMSGALMVELLLDRSSDDLENVIIGTHDTGIKVIKNVISRAA